MDKKEPEGFELNDEFKKAFDLIEKTKTNVFITGRAGTGKSTFLNYLSKNSKKSLVVLAPTGVAAINVSGQTIHSFFRLAPGISVSEAYKEGKNRKNKDLYNRLQTIVIDEISMVRADLLDCIDVFLKGAVGKELPFGGKQIVFIGDLYQLPPVVRSDEMHVFDGHYKSQYFFDAKVMENFIYAQLEYSKIYRQKSDVFIKLLNRIRNKTFEQEDLLQINSRLLKITDDTGYIYLVTTNKMAEEINHSKLGKLIGAEYNVKGKVEGEFNTDSLPAEKVLHLKKGAQVMFLANDSQKRWVNGTLASIISVSGGEIRAKLAGGKEVLVAPHRWEIFRYKFDSLTNSVEKEEIGSFTQYPLRLAWAITIHKSQGKTFEKVIIDIGSGTFAHGQLYVALSRCMTMDGIILKTKIQPWHVMIDEKVLGFGNQK